MWLLLEGKNGTDVWVNMNNVVQMYTTVGGFTALIPTSGEEIFVNTTCEDIMDLITIKAL